jgi:hypothetical protein
MAKNQKIKRLKNERKYKNNVNVIESMKVYNWSKTHFPIIMLKFVFLVLCLVLLASSQEVQPSEVQVLQDQIIDTANNLPTKYCPMRNFKGQLFCPTVKGLNEVEGTSEQSYTVTVDLDAPKVQNNDVAEIESAEDPTNQDEVYIPHNGNNQTVEMMFNTRTVLSGTGFDRIKREIRFPGKNLKIKKKFWNQEME